MDSDEVKSYDCYGQKKCPATEVVIVVENKVSIAVRAILDARRNKDLAKEAECLQKIAKMSDAFKQRFFEMLEKASKQ